MIFSYQGSEEKTIVYVLDSGICQTWKHVYTAVTRGQSRVYIVAKKDGMEKAIRGRVIKRNTRLEGLVVDMLHDLGMAKKDFLSQSQFSTPKRASGFQTSQSTHGPVSSPGQSQAYPEMRSLKDVTWKSPSNPGSGFGGFGSPKSASPSPCKREGVPDNCTTAEKKMKVRAIYILHISLSVLSGIAKRVCHIVETVF